MSGRLHHVARACLACVAGAAGLAAGAGLSHGEPFVTIPGAGGWAGRGVLPGTELIGAAAPRWSVGGLLGPPGTDIAQGHLAAARRGGSLGAQLTLTRLGTSFYEESRLALGVGGTGPDALILVADVRSMRAGSERRSGAGIGLCARVTVGAIELALGSGPGGQLGEARLYPGRHRVSLRAGDGVRAVELVATTVGGGPPAVDVVLGWAGEAWSVGAGVDLVGGGLHVGVGIATPLRLFVERREDPLAGAWTGATVAGAPAGGAAGAGP